MKKICILICCVLILHMLGACSAQKEELQEPVNFYYFNKEIAYNTDSGVICAEVREGSGFSGNLEEMLDVYLSGPGSNTLYSLIPSDTHLIACEIENNQVHVVFDKEFAQLSGIDLSLACSAILLTVRDYAGAEALVVSAKNAQLNEKDQFKISIDDIVLMDTSK